MKQIQQIIVPNSFKSLSHEHFLYYKQDRVLRVFRFKFYS